MFINDKYLSLLFEQDVDSIDLFSELDWANISCNELQPEFIEKYLHKLHLGRLISRNVLSETILNAAICRYQNWHISPGITSLVHKYPINTLVKHKQYINFYIVKYNLVSFEFIKTFENDVNWMSLSAFKFEPDVLDNLLENYADKLNWKHICAGNELTKQQIKKYAQYLYLAIKC